MLTVADALQLPAFAGSQVVAGTDGLDHIVSWVHVVGVPDAARWLNGGELVLTTYINLPPDQTGQRAYIQALVDKGVAAMAMAVGNTVDHAPTHLLEVANYNHFPLIEIPFSSRFIDIARSANERIAQENMAMVTRALTIHRVLTQLVLDGGDLKQLANTLADLIEQSISIENERFEALASANITAFDEARRYTLSEGRTDPRLVHALEDRGVLGEIRRTLRPVFIPAMPDVGLEMERILAPVVVHGDIYGYVWIIADDRPLNDLDHMAIESASTIAALMLLHQEAVQSAEASLKGSFLAQLIEGGNGRGAVLTDQALRFGIDLNAPFNVLVVESDDRQKLPQIYRRIHRLAGLHQWPLVAGQFAGQVVMLVQSEADLDAITAQIHEQANGGGLRISLSAPQSNAERVPLAYEQCGEALQIARRMQMPDKTIAFVDLGYLHTLYHAGPESLRSNPYVPGLRKLLDEHQADLFHTLEAYLDEGGNGVQTAETLMIHRSTLNYRLERIKEICAYDLSDPSTRVNLQVALKLLRLFEGA
ncbi:MAG: PucR family transcriptional regulator ligand-binding domain-containing protein [Anaerolineae bacterium]|nr:PucR family transcriptional regulator ligand-binding domain-containing protein [Anaerolineae bacterium]